MTRALCLALLVTAMPTAASALKIPTFETPKEQPLWSLNVRFSPYRPRISSNTDTRTYFVANFLDGLINPTFGHGPLLKTVEIDYYFLRTFGRLGVTLSFGYWNIEGYSRICGTEEKPEGCSLDEIITFQSRNGETDQSLTVIPISLSAVYRADQLMQQFDVPLMPYVRAGFNYSFWWARAGGDLARDDLKRPGEGGTWGFHATAGLALNLNWLDPTTHSGYNMLGMIGAHLFIETSYISANGFGASPHRRLDLSDFTGSLGLTIDFR